MPQVFCYRSVQRLPGKLLTTEHCRSQALEKSCALKQRDMGEVTHCVGAGCWRSSTPCRCWPLERWLCCRSQVLEKSPTVQSLALRESLHCGGWHWRSCLQCRSRSLRSHRHYSSQALDRLPHCRSPPRGLWASGSKTPSPAMSLQHHLLT